MNLKFTWSALEESYSICADISAPAPEIVCRYLA